MCEVHMWTHLPRFPLHQHEIQHMTQRKALEIKAYRMCIFLEESLKPVSA